MRELKQSTPLTDLEGTLSKRRNGEGGQEKNSEILIKWLIWPVISTGAKSQVPTQLTDYTAGQTGGGQQEKHIKTLMMGGKNEVKESNEE